MNDSSFDPSKRSPDDLIAGIRKDLKVGKHVVKHKPDVSHTSPADLVNAALSEAGLSSNASEANLASTKDRKKEALQKQIDEAEAELKQVEENLKILKDSPEQQRAVELVRQLDRIRRKVEEISKERGEIMRERFDRQDKFALIQHNQKLEAAGRKEQETESSSHPVIDELKRISNYNSYSNDENIAIPDVAEARAKRDEIKKSIIALREQLNS